MDREDGWISINDPEEGGSVTLGRSEAVAFLGVLRRFIEGKDD